MSDHQQQPSIELPPPDVVPTRGLTPEVAELLRANVGKSVEVHWPGEVILDPDGLPIGMTPNRTMTAILARPVLDLKDFQ